MSCPEQGPLPGGWGEVNDAHFDLDGVSLPRGADSGDTGSRQRRTIPCWRVHIEQERPAQLAALIVAVSFGGPEQAKAEGGPLKIGVLTDMSSLYSDNGGPGSVVAAQMAIEDFGGSVLGRKIELVSGDHQNKADVGGTLAKRWIDN